MSLTSPASASSQKPSVRPSPLRIVGVFALIFAVAGAASFLGTPAGRRAVGLKPSHDALVKEVEDTANKMRKGLPKDVGNGMRWDTVESSGTTLTYLYTFTPAADPQRMNYLPDAVRAEVKAMLCGAAELRPLFDNEVLITMRVRDSLGREMGSVDANRQLCGHP